MDVQVVYPNAFMDNATLEKVTLKAVKVIGSAAFWNASALREVVLPEDSDCQVIGIRAFYGCEALEKVTAAGGVMCIYRQAFEGCTALREVTVGSAFTAWNSDATESAPFGANSNLAEKLTGDMLTWWFFDPIVDEATAKQLIAAANIT